MRRVAIIMVLTTAVRADEPKKESAAITAVEPAAMVPGGKTVVKIRGFKLKDATEVRFPKAPGITAAIAEKKDAGQLNGLENKITGDTQLTAEITLPADAAAGVLELVIATPAGDAAAKIPVVSAAAAVEEKEPNNGFDEAQKLVPGQCLRGSIQGEKEVDVYQITGTAGKRLRASVTGGSALTMDAVLTCYDSRGQFVAANDDTDSRDPVLTVAVPDGGVLYLCVSDAHDKGDEWHSYVLSLEDAK